MAEGAHARARARYDRGMKLVRSMVSFAATLTLVACGKGDKQATPTSGTGSAPSAVTPPAEPTPAPPAPAPVKMTAEELHPTCAKIFTPELIAKTHGATEVTEQGSKVITCELKKGADVVGSVTVACMPDLDASLIERERGAMTKAKDLPPGIGRGGYRISNSFVVIDDETPCRLMINFMEPPADDALPDVLRAITAAVNPGTLK